MESEYPGTNSTRSPTWNAACGAARLIRDEDVVDPGRGHRFGLAELGTGDPVGPRLEELVRERWDLDGFRVGPPGDSGLLDDDVPHLRNIALELIQIHHQERSLELSDPAPDHVCLAIHGVTSIAAALADTRSRSVAHGASGRPLKQDQVQGGVRCAETIPDVEKERDDAPRWPPAPFT